MTGDRRRCALVTGASSGIGEAFCRELAAGGFDLVLTARRRERLGALAQELERGHRVKTLVVPGDLADPEVPRQLLAAVGGAGLNVDVLVNNAGYGLPGHYLDYPWERHAEFIQVLLTSVAHTTRLVLPGMVERGWGRVINVGSLGALLTSSKGHTLYAAAKAFVLKMSESLALELEGTGVRVTACCPGFTYSEFHDVMGNREQVSKLPSFMWMDAAEVARKTIDAAERGQVVFIPGPPNRALAGLSRLLPRALALKIASQVTERTQKQG
jgi:short-subunit dehydrogenase